MAADMYTSKDDTPGGQLPRNHPKISRPRRRPPKSVSARFPSFVDELRDEGEAFAVPEVSATPKPTATPPTGNVNRDMSNDHKFLDLRHGFSVNLNGLEKDITVISAREPNETSGEKHPVSDEGIKPTDRIFVERNGKFYALPYGTQLNITTKDDLQQIGNRSSGILQIHRIFRKTSLLIHGFLAGFAAVTAVIVWKFAPVLDAFQASLNTTVPSAASSRLHSDLDTISAINTVHRFLITIVCVSSLCRIDPIHTFQEVFEADFLVQLIISGLNFTAAILTHVIDLSDNEVGRGLIDQSRWRLDENRAVDASDRKSMEAARAVLLGAAWVLLSCTWKRDRMWNALRMRNDKSG